MIAPLPEGRPTTVPPLTSLEDPLSNPRVRALAMDIAYRLRPLCEDLSEGDLVRLVTRVAIIEQGRSERSSPTTRRGE